MALLLSLALTVVTGLIADQGEGKPSTGQSRAGIVAQAFADEHKKAQNAKRGEEGESAIGEAHAALANITLALVVFHILGVGFASSVHRENLVRAMVTGEKRANEDTEDA